MINHLEVCMRTTKNTEVQMCLRRTDRRAWREIVCISTPSKAGERGPVLHEMTEYKQSDACPWAPQDVLSADRTSGEVRNRTFHQEDKFQKKFNDVVFRPASKCEFRVCVTPMSGRRPRQALSSRTDVHTKCRRQHSPRSFLIWA